MTAVVVYLQNALNPEAREVRQVESGTIRDYAPQTWVHPFVAFVDGKPVLRSGWDLELQDGSNLAFVDVNAIPMAGGGGGGSEPLRIMAMIAVMVMAPQLGAMMGSSMLGGAVMGLSASTWTGIISMAGMALVNAVIPPPKPPSPMQAAQMASPSPTYSLQSQGNYARLESAIPEHFGRIRVFPDLAAQPYVDYWGNQQNLYQLLCIGRGHYEIEPLHVEDTPISSFNGVALELIRPGNPVTLFPSRVVSSGEVSGQEILEGAPVGPFSASGPGDECVELALDFVMPRGLFYYSDGGNLSTMTVTLRPEAQLIDSDGEEAGSWFPLLSGQTYGPWSDWTLYAEGPAGSVPQPPDSDTVSYMTRQEGGGDAASRHLVYRRSRSAMPNTVQYTAASNTAQRYTLSCPVPRGRYRVRVYRIGAKDGSNRAGHEAVWAGLKAFMGGTEVYGDVTLLAVRIRADGNISGQASRKLNLVATRKLPVREGNAWTGLQTTRSPAWALTYLAKQVGLNDSQLDLQGITQLAQVWETRNDCFDGRFDNFVSFWEAATKILQAGRAKPYLQGGVLRAVRDQAQSLPVAMFSMRNIAKGSFSVDYLMPTQDTALAVKATYLDRRTWKSSTVTAKLSDIPGQPVDPSERMPAKIDLFGVTDRAQAYREALYQVAANRFRRKLIKFSTEMEGFIPSLGDLISIQHDMPGWGQGGEVVGIDGGTYTLTLSEHLEWRSGLSHYIVFRTADGATDGPYLATPGASSDKVVLPSLPFRPLYIGDSQERTHFSFGWAETYRQLARVVSVKPSSSGKVAIECVNEDSNVHTAELGVVAPQPATSQLAGYANAPTVVGLAINPISSNRRKFAVSWQPSPWAREYVVEQRGASGIWQTVQTTPATSITLTALTETDNAVRVAAVNLAQGPWIQKDLDLPGMELVEGMLFTVTQHGVLLTWSKPTEEAYQETELRLGPWEAGQTITRKSSTSHLLDWQPAGNLTVSAKHFDRQGGSSPTASTASIQISPPNSVQVDRSDVQVNTVALGWRDAKSSQPIKSYAIYTGDGGAPLGASTLYGKAGSDSRSDIVIFKSSGSKRVYLVAEDVAGNLSAPTSMDFLVALPTNFTLSSEWDSTWSGDKVNAVVEGTSLLLPVNGSETWDGHFSSRGWANSDQQVAAGYPLVFQPGELVGSYREQHDIGKVISSAKISVTVQSSTLAGSVIPTVGIEWSVDGVTWSAGPPGSSDVQVVGVRYVRVTYSVVATGRDDLVRLTRVNTTVSSVEMAEYGALDVNAGDVNGTPYVCEKNFSDVVTAIATPNNSANISRINVIIDDQASPATVYVQAWDTSNQRTSGRVSLQLGGY